MVNLFAATYCLDEFVNVYHVFLAQVVFILLFVGDFCSFGLTVNSEVFYVFLLENKKVLLTFSFVSVFVHSLSFQLSLIHI